MPILIDQIEGIKKSEWTDTLDPSELNDLVLDMSSSDFMGRATKRFSSDVKVGIITDSVELEKYAMMTQSCLFRKPGDEQTRAYERFLADEGALYFSVEDEGHIGYVRFYAGRRIRERDDVLFEDNLRTRIKGAEGQYLFQPEFKAVALKILEHFELQEDSYLFVPESHRDKYGASVPLVLKKLGSNYFKKGHLEDFYRGEFDSIEDAPKFAHATTLLE